MQISTSHKVSMNCIIFVNICHVSEFLLSLQKERFLWLSAFKCHHVTGKSTQVNLKYDNMNTKRTLPKCRTQPASSFCIPGSLVKVPEAFNISKEKHSGVCIQLQLEARTILATQDLSCEHHTRYRSPLCVRCTFFYTYNIYDLTIFMLFHQTVSTVWHEPRNVGRFLQTLHVA